MPMPLNQLLPQAQSSTLIRELTLDSRMVRPGDLFLAVPGTRVDGRRYIADAIARGAAAVAYESEDAPEIQDSAALLIPVRGLQAQLSAISGRFYGEPSRALTMLGVTGTNGKTTVSHLLAQALDQLGESCAVIGTLGNGFLGSLHSGIHTTPDPISLQAALADLKQAGASHVAMEVSSHGLEQQRLAAVDMDIAVLTNLTRDHLDYHGSMEAYAEAKARLFAWPGLKVRVLNLDDDFGAQLARQYAGKELKTYSINKEHAHVHCRQVEYSNQGIRATVATTQGEALLRSPLLGRFNLSNLMAVVATLSGMGYALRDILDVIPGLRPPAGRMQALSESDKPLVVVDYAHTPDALQQVLIAVRSHVVAGGQLHCVFGCGGERDRGKRELMAAVAEASADRLLVTDDNPRNEDAAQIRADILAGLTPAADVQEFDDRAAAIATAIGQARAGDVVVIAGKGHEDYQEVRGQRHPFSDLEQARQALEAWEAVHV
ncbi:MAG: UDP-N-acetylmuramoyl-L-alanyl-D-glutamate--2,6-diaminopimelate ligase [Gammaproteobacteria bacterium]|nr:UDP-N-acetylmuramoyl-L-alanyl-D-glutamate--2,6-diaminopimelate ligase [Gammaproteobacteria bacterium]